MKKFLLFCTFVFAALGCNSEDEARSALLDAGYTNISMKGYEWLGCGQDDTFHDGFTATGPTGRRVRGVVCSGWSKGATIRTMSR